MTLVCLFPVASMAASVVGRSLVFALAISPQLDGSAADAPTPKEQALMEHACGTPLTPAAYAARERCVAARLVSLRADFGRDLGRLSAVARNKLDAACSPLQASRGREAYVDCLSVQLASLSTASLRATPPPPAETTLSAPAATPSSAAESTPTVPQRSSLLSVQSAVIFLVAFAGMTALVIIGFKGRRAKLVCRVCGVSVPGAGDLCAPCRREAADAVRHAAGERVGRQRANEAQQRRQREHADEQRREQQRQEQEDCRLEERRVEDESRRREEDAQSQAQAEYPPAAQAASACDAADAVFDPHRALGLMSNASGDEVRAAYEAARAKYDPDQVAHLGPEVLEHYSAKFHANERAYRMLAGAIAQ